MSLLVGSTVDVVDRKDGKTYCCKIVQTNEATEKVKVHFVGWSSGRDEWIHRNSDRIVLSEEVQPSSILKETRNKLERSLNISRDMILRSDGRRNPERTASGEVPEDRTDGAAESPELQQPSSPVNPMTESSSV